MNSIYMRLYDFFHTIANYFWHKHIDVIKQQSNPKKNIIKAKTKSKKRK